MIIDTNLFAGTYGGVWKRPLSELITSVNKYPTPVPTQFILDQNYPNPFNPLSTIRYGLPQRSQVTLTVFITLGQQVAVLQNGVQGPGYHEVRFDGSGLASGVYFYRLSVSPLARRDPVTQERDGQAGTFVQTRKLLLLR